MNQTCIDWSLIPGFLLCSCSVIATQWGQKKECCSLPQRPIPYGKTTNLCHPFVKEKANKSIIVHLQWHKIGIIILNLKMK